MKHEGHRREGDSVLRTVREPVHTPPLSLFLGHVAMAPLALAALTALAMEDPSRQLAIQLAALWSGALLCFLSGVRRGVSFRTEGGPRPAQIATMLWLFLLGVATLATYPPMSIGFALAGFVTMLILDPLAARRGETPAFFARLRPIQMLVPSASLAILLWVSAD